MKIVELFSSIEGEGIRAGYLCTFIRKFGCNLNCSYCDSRYACEGNEYTEMSVEEIIAKVKEYGNPFVTITGGEPLCGDKQYLMELQQLIEELVNLEYFINIETNGSYLPPEELKPYPIFYTFDYKCQGSGMEDKMFSPENWQSLFNGMSNNVLKFVVGSVEEIEKADTLVRKHMTDLPYYNIYLSPVFGKIEPKDIVETMKRLKMNYARLQLQMHKFIWPPEMKGV